MKQTIQTTKNKESQQNSNSKSIPKNSIQKQ
jgi:hypothetical protein